MPARAFSVGYEGRSVEELVALLAEAGVQRIVDVRELPLSRRKGFSKTPLREALATRGIDYVHLRAAGNPFRDKTLVLEESLARYAAHLDGHPEILDEVEGALADRPAALLCLERDVKGCHRSVIVDRLLRRDPGRGFTHL